ncbi:MAG TPA: hypothetical protein PKM83_03640 [Ferruginibacter sp.]|nr:hypothetical protein [Ferruginibacter sp.]HNO98808.1 hypothetical protein [Ferruginibacter sp.]
MTRFLLIFLLLGIGSAFAQKIESLHVNLYTDSLKKGTYNYINIDGKMPNGRYIPLDSTHLLFWASAGTFKGNSLWIDRNFNGEKIDFKVTLRSNPALFKEFSIYIKKLPDPELKSMDEIMKSPKDRSKRSK